MADKNSQLISSLFDSTLDFVRTSDSPQTVDEQGKSNEARNVANTEAVQRGVFSRLPF
jgi:hypothetical protein